MTLKISQSRSARPYTRSEYMGRILWALVLPLFRFSPRVCFGWRAWLLRCFGAKIARGVHIYPSVRITIPWNLELGTQAAIGEGALIYNLGMVRIGARATISHLAHVCAGTHDYEDPGLPLLRLPVVIGDDAWICAQSFVGPGVTIGDGAVVGACAVAMKDVPAWVVVAGNPARVVKQRRLREAADS